MPPINLPALDCFNIDCIPSLSPPLKKEGIWTENKLIILREFSNFMLFFKENLSELDVEAHQDYNTSGGSKNLISNIYNTHILFNL